MKKSDLLPGMIVTLRNGINYIVLKNYECNFYFANAYNYIPFKQYNENLCYNYDLDVVKVYRFTCAGSGLYWLLQPNEGTTHKLLWKREETKEMTVAEISKALGYEVKVVRS